MGLLRERVVVHSHSVAVHSHPFLVLWGLPAEVEKAVHTDFCRVGGFWGIETVFFQAASLHGGTSNRFDDFFRRFAFLFCMRAIGGDVA